MIFFWGGGMLVDGSWSNNSLNVRENLPGFGCQCHLVQKPLPPFLNSLFPLFFLQIFTIAWMKILQSIFSIDQLSLTFLHFSNVLYSASRGATSSNAFKSESQIIVAIYLIEFLPQILKIFNKGEEMNSMLLPN